MFIKRGDGKILSVEQDEKAEESRKSTVKQASESSKPTQSPDTSKKSES